MELPHLTQKPIQHVDCTPDAEYPLRILRAYRHNAGCEWKYEGPEPEWVVVMNEHCRERAAILDAAISLLARGRSSSEPLESESVSFIENVLRLTAKHDMTDMLAWSDGPDGLSVAMICNDTFFWATADAEGITPETLPALQQAIEDAAALGPLCEIHGGDLYAARQRQMRPQGAAYPHERAMWPLFDACGPERPLDFDNPFTPEQYETQQRKDKEVCVNNKISPEANPWVLPSGGE